VSIFEEKKVEEIKAQSFMATINALKDIFSDKETIDFLTQAMK
jgi:cell division protein ZapA (FtsZ GTPase activity inhibitor)